MSISCKCSNFVATSSKLQQPSRSFDVTAEYRLATKSGAGVPLSTELSQVFQQKYPRDFPFYTEFMNFFKHALGPISDLNVNVINQHALLYGLTLDAGGESWQLSFCYNCKDVLCAKRLTAGAGATPNQYLINSTLLSNGEELAQRRGLKSYSETFHLLIMERTDNSGALSPPPTGATTGMVDSSSSFSIGSLAANPLDTQGQRLRQLLADKQARQQEEIKNTNERIERYAYTEFERLKSFREKADQDCAQLMQRIRLLPDNVVELLDSGMTPDLEVNWLPSASGARRRNTISSRRELSNPTTPTTTLNHPPSFLALNQPTQQQQQQLQPSQPTQPQLQPLSSAASSSMASARLRKMSNFDTPPATPEATPMSVGNSPTFRQQQQQSSVAAAPHLLSTHGEGGGGVTANGADDADDCLFDLEDVEEYTDPQPVPSSIGYGHNLMYQREHSFQPQQNRMVDDLDEADTADEAEDALDLDSSISIPAGRGGRPTPAQLMNFARSLPIEMPNSTIAERAAAANNNNNNFALGCEEGLDNIDIAASIQALTKSVHGEAVFGDLPRPRLRSQIEG
ncbi:uncharacterized protein LOC117891050 [Drosophila subobscura]|uniref:uncharacterized protein LOC117891050 n=1 Tax=Drosophila subobscura TaxID=7241 RepID=UPI00155A9AE6|nr:uncharacterized protein LOC117891050 [Drosophila subobscura]